MSNYEILENSHYSDLKEWPINLKDYMMINDVEKSEKFLFLKLQNQEKYAIQSVVFQIKQYDKSKLLINESEYVLKELSLSPYQSHMPLKKYRLDAGCASIEYTLVMAETNSSTWKKGSWNEKNTSLTFYQGVTKHNHKNISLRPFITLALLVFYIAALTLVFYLVNG